MLEEFKIEYKCFSDRKVIEVCVSGCYVGKIAEIESSEGRTFAFFLHHDVWPNTEYRSLSDCVKAVEFRLPILFGMQNETRINKKEKNMGKSKTNKCEELRDKVDRVKTFASAYPVSVFPEPTEREWKDIRKVLTKGGYRLGNISASAMRHVVTQIIKILEEE